MTKTVPPQLETALRELTRLIKAVQYYPPGHPALSGAASAARNAFLPLLETGDNLLCTVRKEGFLFADLPVNKTNQVLQQLAAFLFARLVKHLVILPDLSIADLLTFGRALTVDPAEVRRQGGLKEALLRDQVTTIWVNETDLSRILEAKQEIETARDDNPQEDLGADQPPAVPEEAEERSLSALLKRLRQARDDHQFRALLQDVVPLALMHRTAEGRMQLLEALALLCQLSADRSQEQVRREYAYHALLQIAEPETVDFLVEMLCEKDLAEKYHELLIRILVFLKQRSISRLMERLAKEPKAGIRKRLAAALVRQGTQAIPVLAEYMQDERWYVVRNTATILGDIRDAGAARYLNTLLHHEDIRVCREAIRALTRIGGGGAVQILLEAMDDEDEEISRQALLSLGVIGDATAVHKLARVIHRRDFFLKQLGHTRDAIRALGEIGSANAVPALSSVLRRRRIFKRRPYNELRAAAAQALGEIGDPGSEPLLRKATRDRSPEVARLATQALKHLQREHEPGTV